MARKRRTEAPGASDSSEAHGQGGGVQRPPGQQQQGTGLPQGGAQRAPGQQPHQAGQQQPQQGGNYPQGGVQHAPGQQQPQPSGGVPRAPGQQQSRPGAGYPQGGAQRAPGQQQQGSSFPQGGAQRAPGQQLQGAFSQGRAPGQQMQGSGFPQGGAQQAPSQQPNQGFPQGGVQQAPGQQNQGAFPQGGSQRGPGQHQQGSVFPQGGAQRAPDLQNQGTFPQGGAQQRPGQQQQGTFPQGGALRAPGQLPQGGGYQRMPGQQPLGASYQQGVRGPQQGAMPPQQYQQQQGRGSQPRPVVPQQQQQPRSGYVGGPLATPSVPDLHQAASGPPLARVSARPARLTQPVPYTKAIDTREVGASSSSSVAPQPNPVQLTQELKKLSIPEEGSSSLAIQPAPASSKAMRFPLRPGRGNIGTKCIVKANHFFAELPDKDLHQYDVTITPEVTSRGVNRAVILQLVTIYRDSHLAKRLPAYDGRKSLYTAGPLPFMSKEFKIVLVDKDDGSRAARREREFKVNIKLVARIDLHHLELFLQGKVADAPQEAIQVLDIVLREHPTETYCPVGRSFYSPALGTKQPLGDGLESWRGFYQSIRPTQMGLSLNIDMSSTAFIEELPVLDFVCQLLNRDVCARPLSDSDRVKIKKALRGVKVEVTHRGKMRRKYRIAGLTPQATRELSFPIDDQGTMKSVIDYFQETYGFTINFTRLPCLQVGNPQKPNYLPMEVCKIVAGQRYSKRLNEKQINELLKVTCQRPKDRENDIFRTVRRNNYNDDKYAKEFGIKISDQLAVVEARVLPAPRLKYHETGREKDCLPQVGQWNMKNKKMVNGGAVNSWLCISFAKLDEYSVIGFCLGLAQMCNTSGMVYKLEPVLPPISARPDQVERVLKARFHEAMDKLHPQGKELDLLVLILPDVNGPLYGDIKRICETDLGVISQCCLLKHARLRNPQYLANVALKINVKVGGRNTVLMDAISRRIPLLSDVPTIIFGADVTHPHPGEDISPSIAAVVASQDWPEVTKYAGLVCAQEHRQELIQELYKEWEGPAKGRMTGGMVKELLVSFYKETRRKPERIIFYRDGVSEGQFYQVLLHEIDAIRKACASLEPTYQPPITFVIVQKRHHTRLFANNHNDWNTIDRSGNILPGTVVDSKICHPTEFDFYLCSHAGIQGTSRPAHYHVLWDENNFTADKLQTLTNNLCYTYARCTRSVSIVPPAFYAHLAAFRARFYMEPDTSDGTGGRGGGQRGTRAAPGGSNAPPVRPLPALRDNVKRVMFYI